MYEELTTPWASADAAKIIKDIKHWAELMGMKKSDYTLWPPTPKPAPVLPSVHFLNKGLEECWCGEPHTFKGLDREGNMYNPKDFE